MQHALFQIAHYLLTILFWIILIQVAHMLLNGAESSLTTTTYSP